MLRSLLRWVVRAAATVLVLFVLAVVVDYFTHRVSPTRFWKSN